MQPSDTQFNPDNLDEWMSAHIDGMLDAASAAQLDAYLAENPDAQAEFNALRSVVDALGSLPPADAPADLLDNVMAQVTSAPAETTHERDEAPLTRPAYSMTPWIRRAAGIAAVLLVARVGYHEWGQQQAPRSIDTVTSTEEAVHASVERLDEISAPVAPVTPRVSAAAAKPASSTAPVRESVRRQAEVVTDFRSTREANAPNPITVPEEREEATIADEAMSADGSKIGGSLSGALAPAGKSSAKELDRLHDAPADDIAKRHEDRKIEYFYADRKNIAPAIVAEEKTRYRDQSKAGIARDIAPSRPSAGPEKQKGRIALKAEIGKKDQPRDESPAPADINGGGFKVGEEESKPAIRKRAAPKSAPMATGATPLPAAEQDVDALGFDESSTVAFTLRAEPQTHVVDSLKKTAPVAGEVFKRIDADAGALPKQPLQNAVDNKASFAQDRESGQDDNEAMLRSISKDPDAIPVRLRGSIADVDAVIADFQTPRPSGNEDRQKAPASGITSDYAEQDGTAVSEAANRSNTHAVLRVVHLDAERYAEFIKALSAVGALIEKPKDLQQGKGWLFSKRHPKRITIYLLIDPPAVDAPAGQ